MWGLSLVQRQSVGERVEFRKFLERLDFVSFCHDPFLEWDLTRRPILTNSTNGLELLFLY